MENLYRFAICKSRVQSQTLSETTKKSLQFGEEHYKNSVHLSLNLVPDVRNFLKGNINPLEVIAYLESLYNVRITPHNTLIILDEIQDCKRALLALKYFQEEYPQYDIVAAGSLLGVAVNKGEKEQEEDAVQQAILNGYDSDMGKYAKPATTVKIKACWNSIPAQLAKENKKFQYKLAKKGGTAKIFGEAINLEQKP